MGVKIKDRDKKVEEFRLACTLSGISIGYETAELVSKIYEKHKELGNKFSVMHAGKIQASHEQKWDDYHRAKSKLTFEKE